MKKNIVVLTGAGISAESGISTFRGAGGLWEGHDIMEVASPEGYQKNPKLVLDFYNQRRKQLSEVKPNLAHTELARLETYFNVHIITQNVDDLHERGGSTNVLHLHGELTKARSSVDPSLVYDIKGAAINEGDLCEKGSQLRPHIVWFGEQVPLMQEAEQIVQQADIFIVIGTSLEVYPAAGLLYFVQPDLPKYIIDPHIPKIAGITNITTFEENASTGMQKLAKMLIEEHKG